MNCRAIALSVSLLSFLAGAAAAQSSSPANALRIVVIEGEAAINIIQQKTAVAPVVEVRDRNDQPVAGATVRFTIQGGRASFNGARTVSMTTNVAGRAQVSSLTPSSAGAFQISASAVFQGLSAAVTIAQTNVMTIAQAAAIGAGAAGVGATAGAGAGVSAGGASAGASAGGAAGAAGGGLSITTLGIVGGAAAGGAIATKKLVDVFSVATYKGPFRIETIETSNSDPNQALCTSTLAFVGTLTAEFQEQGDGTIMGELHSEWSVTEIARTCRNPKGPIPGEQRGSDLTGTTANLRVTDGFGGNTLSFSGALSGSVINGTWTMAGSYIGPPDASGHSYTASNPPTSASVTLAKQ